MHRGAVWKNETGGNDDEGKMGFVEGVADRDRVCEQEGVSAHDGCLYSGRSRIRTDVFTQKIRYDRKLQRK